MIHDCETPPWVKKRVEIASCCLRPKTEKYRRQVSLSLQEGQSTPRASNEPSSKYTSAGLETESSNVCALEGRCSNHLSYLLILHVFLNPCSLWISFSQDQEDGI